MAKKFHIRVIDSIKGTFNPVTSSGPMLPMNEGELGDMKLRICDDCNYQLCMCGNCHSEECHEECLFDRPAD